MESRAAARILVAASTEQKDVALKAMAAALRAGSAELCAVNLLDVEDARVAGKNAGFLDRLLIDPARVDGQLVGSPRLISCALPGASLAARLTPSERSVANLMIEGKTHVEIAADRGTTLRTTANQLASIFAKLGVSGRGELRSKAIREASMVFTRKVAGEAKRRVFAPLRHVPSGPEMLTCRG